MKISFDFDSTLSRKIVQDYASYLQKKGYDIYVCTSRLSPEMALEKENSTTWNEDLFKITDELNISRDKIIFTNYDFKYKYIDNIDFILHFDDDFVEIDLINKLTKIKGISVYGNTYWKNKANRLLGFDNIEEKEL